MTRTKHKRYTLCVLDINLFIELSNEQTLSAHKLNKNVNLKTYEYCY